MKNFFEIIGGILTALMFLIFFWLMLYATPDQMSAECDALTAEMEGGAK